MLNGIDISNWQAGLDLRAMPDVQFAIMKATEGTTFVDRYCDGWVQQAIQIGKLWGFYHFARNGDPIAEADHFVDSTVNYFGHGIPVLDWETGETVDWVNSFVRRVHDRTGIWPWVYGNPWRFNQGGVEPNCGRWVASYPDHLVNPGFGADPGTVPDTDGAICCWQYASDGRVPGYVGDLDINEFYGDAEVWTAYAKAAPPTPEKEQGGSCDEAVHVVRPGDTIIISKS